MPRHIPYFFKFYLCFIYNEILSVVIVLTYQFNQYKIYAPRAWPEFKGFAN